MLGLSFLKGIVDSVVGYFSSHSETNTGLMLRGGATDSDATLVLGSAVLTSVVTALQQMPSSSSIDHAKSSLRGSVLDMATAERLASLGEETLLPVDDNVLNLDDLDTVITTHEPVVLDAPVLPAKIPDSDVSVTSPEPDTLTHYRKTRHLQAFSNIYDTYTVTTTTGGTVKYFFQTNAEVFTPVAGVGGEYWGVDTPTFSQASPRYPMISPFYNATELSLTYIVPDNTVGLRSTLVTFGEYFCTEPYPTNKEFSGSYCYGLGRNYVLTFNINATNQGYGPSIYINDGFVTAPVGQLKVVNPATAPQLNGFAVVYSDKIKNYTEINNVYTQPLLPTQSLVGLSVTDAFSTITIDTATGVGHYNYPAPMAALSDVWVLRTITDSLQGLTTTLEYCMQPQNISPVMLTQALPTMQVVSGNAIYIIGPTCRGVNPIYYGLVATSSPGVGWSAQTNQAIIASPVPGTAYNVEIMCTDGIAPALTATTVVTVQGQPLEVNAAFLSSGSGTPGSTVSLSLLPGTVHTLDGTDGQLTYALADYYTNSAGTQIPLNGAVTFDTSTGAGTWRIPPGTPADTYTFYTTVTNQYGVSTVLPRRETVQPGVVSLTNVSPVFAAGSLGAPYRQEITSLLSNPFGYDLQVQLSVRNSDGSTAPLTEATGFYLETTTDATGGTHYFLVSDGVEESRQHTWPLVLQATSVDSAGNQVGTLSGTATLTTASLAPVLAPNQALDYTGTVLSGSVTVAVSDPNGSPLTYTLDNDYGIFKVSSTATGFRVSYGSAANLPVSSVDATYPLVVTATNADGLSTSVPVSVYMEELPLVVTPPTDIVFYNGVSVAGILTVDCLAPFVNPNKLPMTASATIDSALVPYATFTTSGVTINPQAGIQAEPHEVRCSATTGTQTAEATVGITYIPQPIVAMASVLDITYQASDGLSYVIPGTAFQSTDGQVAVSYRNLPPGAVLTGIGFTIPKDVAGIWCGPSGPYLLGSVVGDTNTTRIDLCINAEVTSKNVWATVLQYTPSLSGVVIVGVFANLIKNYRKNMQEKAKFEEKLQKKSEAAERLLGQLTEHMKPAGDISELKESIGRIFTAAYTEVVGIMEFIKQHTELESYSHCNPSKTSRDDFGGLHFQRSLSARSGRVANMAHEKGVDSGKGGVGLSEALLSPETNRSLKDLFDKLQKLDRHLTTLSIQVHEFKTRKDKGADVAFHAEMTAKALHFKKLCLECMASREFGFAQDLLEKTLDLYYLVADCWSNSKKSGEGSVYNNLDGHGLLRGFSEYLSDDLKALGCSDARDKKEFFDELVASKPWILPLNERLCHLLEFIYKHDVLGRKDKPLVVTTDIKYNLTLTLTAIIQALRATGSVKDTVIAEQARTVLLLLPDDMPTHFPRFLRGLVYSFLFERNKYQQTQFQLGRGIPRSWVVNTYMLRELAVLADEYQSVEGLAQIEAIYHEGKGSSSREKWPRVIQKLFSGKQGVNPHVSYWALTAAAKILVRTRDDKLVARCLKLITDIITQESSFKLRGFSSDVVRNVLFEQLVYPSLTRVTKRLLAPKHYSRTSPALSSATETKSVATDTSSESKSAGGFARSGSDSDGSPHSSAAGSGSSSGGSSSDSGDSSPYSAGSGSSTHSEEDERLMDTAYHNTVKAVLSLRLEGYQALLNTYIRVDYPRLVVGSDVQKRYHEMLQHVLSCADVPFIRSWLTTKMLCVPPADGRLDPLRDALYRLAGELLSDKANHKTLKTLKSCIKEWADLGDVKAQALNRKSPDVQVTISPLHAHAMRTTTTPYSTMKPPSPPELGSSAAPSSGASLIKHASIRRHSFLTHHAAQATGSPPAASQSAVASQKRGKGHSIFSSAMPLAQGKPSASAPGLGMVPGDDGL